MTLEAVVVGMVVGFIATVLGAYVYDRFGLDNFASLGSEHGSRKRIERLEAELETVTNYHNDKSALNSFLLSRLVFAASVFVFECTGGALIGLVFSGTNSIGAFIDPLYFKPDNINTFIDKIFLVMSTLMTGLTVVLLFWSFSIAYRAYALYRKVQNFEIYQPKAAAKLERLKKSINQS